MTPAAYLACLASLSRGGHRKLGFILIAPIILPFSALKNSFAAFDNDEPEHFTLDIITFLKVYEGAAKSNGSCKDLVKCIRESLDVARELG